MHSTTVCHTSWSSGRISVLAIALNRTFLRSSVALMMVTSAQTIFSDSFFLFLPYSSKTVIARFSGMSKHNVLWCKFAIGSVAFSTSLFIATMITISASSQRIDFAVLLLLALTAFLFIGLLVRRMNADLDREHQEERIKTVLEEVDT